MEIILKLEASTFTVVDSFFRKIFFNTWVSEDLLFFLDESVNSEKN